MGIILVPECGVYRFSISIYRFFDFNLCYYKSRFNDLHPTDCTVQYRKLLGFILKHSTVQCCPASKYFCPQQPTRRFLFCCFFENTVLYATDVISRKLANQSLLKIIMIVLLPCNPIVSTFAILFGSTILIKTFFRPILSIEEKHQQI